MLETGPSLKPLSGKERKRPFNQALTLYQPNLLHLSSLSEHEWRKVGF